MCTVVGTGQSLEEKESELLENDIVILDKCHTNFKAGPWLGISFTADSDPVGQKRS